MPAVRTAMCMPSRNDHTATSAATSHCRAFGAVFSSGQSELPAPTKPTENVQMVSTQPELPVRRCTTQAPAIRTESASAITASAARYETIRNPYLTG